MNRERESDRGVRTDGRTDMHRSTCKGYHLFSYNPQSYRGAACSAAYHGGLSETWLNFGFSQRWLWRSNRVLGRDETSCCAVVNTDVSDAPDAFIPNWSSWFLRCQYIYTTVHGVTWRKMLSLWVRIYILLSIRKVHRRSPYCVVLLSWSQIPWDLIYPRCRIVSCFANNACRPLFSGESPEVGGAAMPIVVITRVSLLWSSVMIIQIESIL